MVSEGLIQITKLTKLAKNHSIVCMFVHVFALWELKTDHYYQQHPKNNFKTKYHFLEFEYFVLYFNLGFEPECNAELVFISRKGRSKDNPSLSDI